MPAARCSILLSPRVAPRRAVLTSVCQADLKPLATEGLVFGSPRHIRMTRTLASTAAASAILIGAWALGVGVEGGAAGKPTLRADWSDTLSDTDDDFLPDVVEWAVLTSASAPDTDGDLCADFVEVVQRGTPRQPGVVRPVDHEMRVVVTAPSPGASPTDPTWLHIFFRFVGETSLMTSFQTWIELPALPGIQIPIAMFGFPSVVFRERQTPTDGLWVQFSVPMVSEAMLRAVLPCTIRAEAVIGGRTVAAGVKLFDVQGVTCTLVPFDRERLALQSIGQLGGGSSSGSNRVCVLMLQQVGSGPGGAVFQVVDADCEDCNELECGASCTQSRGWVFSIPGGIETITGG